MDYLTKARSYAVKRLPYMSHLLYFLRPVESDEVPVMAISRTGTLYHNPQACSQRTVEDLAFIMTHEAMHILQDAHGRRQNRDPLRWNFASDIAVNDLLESCGLTLPEDGLSPRLYKLQRFKSAEHYYKRLQVDQIKNFFSDLIGDLPGNFEGEIERTIEEVDMARNSCAQDIKKYSEQYGRVPSDLVREVENLCVPPKQSWKTIFRRKVKTCLIQATSGKYDYSYNKVARRDSDVILPGLIGYKAKLGILLDTSGSMSKELLSECMAQAKHISKLFDEIWFLSIDTEVHTCFKVKNFRDVFKEGKIKGGGGTMLGPGFTELSKRNVDICLAISDCWADFGAKPKFPTIWMCRKKDHGDPPWGYVVEIE
jgi:predicted metal-dependent peptidase